MILDFFLIALVLLISAIFSGAEAAFVSVDKLELTISNNKDAYRTKVLSSFRSNPSRFIASILIGNTLTLVLYGIFVDDLLHQLFEPLIVSFPILSHDILIIFSKTLCASVIVLFVAEFTPKSFARLNPIFFFKIFTPVLHISYVLFYPIIRLCVAISQLIVVKIFKESYQASNHFLKLSDLESYLKRRLHETNKDKDNKTQFLVNAIAFNEAKLRDLLVPRTEIMAIETNSSLDEAKKKFIDSGHSKLLVYSKDIDHIVGYIHSKHFFNHPKSINEMITDIPVYPETMLAKEVLVALLKLRKSLALVVDEYGGVSGIASTEDIIEEIFGEINDEYDDDELIEKQIDQTTFILSARHEIDYLNEKYQWNLPSDDFDTLGGLIIGIEENIPEVGKKIVSPPYSFEILLKEETRLKTIKLRIIK